MKRMRQILSFGVVVLAVVLMACAGNGPGTTAPEATEQPATGVATTDQSAIPSAPAGQPPAARDVVLTVFAAASLTDAFSEIGRRFEAARPNVTVVYNFAGSNQLATQIGQGAPADVFASANLAQMDATVASGRIDAAAPRMFVTNRLVVIYPANNPAGIATLPDLARPGTLIVLAAEAVPVGRYALEFLDKAAADPAFGATFKDDVLGNVVSYEENVRSVLNKVALGEADAGIVYASDRFGVEGVAQLAIPDALNIVAEYPIAALNDSVHGNEAAAFIDFVLGAEGQSVLTAFGFGAVTAP